MQKCQNNATETKEKIAAGGPKVLKIPSSLHIFSHLLLSLAKRKLGEVINTQKKRDIFGSRKSMHEEDFLDF